FVAGFGDVSEVVVLVVIVMLVVVMFAMLFAVRIGMSFGVIVVVFVIVVMCFVMFRLIVRFGGAADGFTGQDFGGGGRGSLRRGVAVGVAMAMAVIVVFEIFENVADVQEGVAVETDIDEGGLHAGKDAGDAALVDATNERKFFFALDINF